MIAIMEANEIRQLRDELGWTQEQLGEAVGVGRTTVTLWELGINNPSGPARILLAGLRERSKKNLPKKKFKSA